MIAEIWPPPPRWGRFNGWLFILGAIALAMFMIKTFIDQIASRSWPSTYASVLASDIYHVPKGGLWCIKMRYRYVVKKHVYTSDRVTTSFLSKENCLDDEEKALSQLGKLSPGAQISVRYDSNNPGKATYFREELDLVDFLCLFAAPILFWVGVKLITEQRIAKRIQGKGLF